MRIALAGSAALVALSLPAAGFATARCIPLPGVMQLRDATSAQASIHAPAIADVAPFDLTRVAQDDFPTDARMAGIAPADLRACMPALSADGDHVADPSWVQADAAHVVIPDAISVVVSQPLAQVVQQAGDSAAYGAMAIAYSFSELSVTSAGSIDVAAGSSSGNAFAVGAYAAGAATASLDNQGAISASASSTIGDATAYAALVYGSFDGIGLLVNGGDLQAAATAGTSGQAEAIGAYVVANIASIFNDGSSQATAQAGVGGSAVARGARAYGMYSAVSNYGDLQASADAIGGSADARGADVLGYYGAHAYNAGTISASATAAGGSASAIGAYSAGLTFGAYADNVGSITAAASGGSAEAIGMFNLASYLGNAVTHNDGSIAVVAEGTLAAYGVKEAVAFGVYNAALVYDAIVYNQGAISAVATATTDIDPGDGFTQASAIGAEALNGYGYGQTRIANGGDITASATTRVGLASAWGSVAKSTGMYGAVAIDNAGSIGSHAQTQIGVGKAIGAYAAGIAGVVDVVNNGDILADARVDRGVIYVAVDYAYATGVQAISLAYGAGATTVANYGSIQAQAYARGGITGAKGISAYGDYATVTNAAGASISATGETGLFGGGFASGIEAAGLHGVDVVNDGDIAVYGHAHGYSDGTNTFYGASRALGVSATANLYGNVSVTNTGSISVRSVAEDGVTFFNAGAGATGVDTYAKYDASVTNAGDIIASADSQLGITGVYGVMAQGKYSSHIDNQAGARIIATATVGSLASDQYGGRAVSFGTHMFGGDHGYTDNAGEIISHATATSDGVANAGPGSALAFGSSVGAYSHILTGQLDNSGRIEAAAQVDFGAATAYGGFVSSQTASRTSNSGDIRSIAVAEDGSAFAVGSYGFAQHVSVQIDCDAYGCDYANAVYTVDGGDSTLDNRGRITAAATADAGSGDSYGAVLLGAFMADLANSGDIRAIATADDANAVGGVVNSFYGHALLTNSGDIVAQATGDSANAVGASLIGNVADDANGVLAAAVDNAGGIAAVATGGKATATGVAIVGGNGNAIALDNSGVVSASADGSDSTAIAVSLQSDGGVWLHNSGTIAAFGNGERIAVSASGGAAQVQNRGTLVGAIRTGAGDDRLDNVAGSAWLAVGVSDFGAGADRIANHGLIAMDDASIRLGGGDNNVFDNAGTLAVAGRANVLDMDGANALVNDGNISFIDGTADDRLKLIGDFAGQGSLGFDVSTARAAGDRMQVDGSVRADAVQTVDVALVDLPRSDQVRIPLLDASGTLAGRFALGQVAYAPDGFVAMDFSLDQADHTLWLGVDVTGLNATGSLAASLAPGMQDLLDAQVGSWRERMGVLGPARAAGPAPWMRVFSGSGRIGLDHDDSFGTGGDFDFDQSNHGLELGLDVQPADHLSLGVLVAKLDGQQDIDGVGSDRFDGRSFGVYATWLADNGFYLDLSNRWTGLEARLHSSAAAYATQASAQAVNLEAGLRAWTTGAGINIVPQLQYTHTGISDIGRLRGALADFANAGGASSRARLGIAFDRNVQAGGFTWTPYAALNVVREFDGTYAHAINGGLRGSVGAQGTSALVEAGLGVQRDAWVLTGGLHWADGGALSRVAGAQLTLRYGW